METLPIELIDLLIGALSITDARIFRRTCKEYYVLDFINHQLKFKRRLENDHIYPTSTNFTIMEIYTLEYVYSERKLPKYFFVDGNKVISKEKLYFLCGFLRNKNAISSLLKHGKKELFENISMGIAVWGDDDIKKSNNDPNNLLFWSNGNKIPYSSKTCAGAAYGGQLTTLKWLKLHNIVLDNNSDVIVNAAYGGDTKVLDWLIQNVKYYNIIKHASNDLFHSHAAWSGHLHVIKWGIKNGFDFPESHLGTIVRDTIKRGHLNVLKWIDKRYAPSYANCIQLSLQYGHTHVADWLWKKKKFILCDSNFATVIGGGYIESIQWLLKMEYKFTTANILECIVNKNFYLIKLLLDEDPLIISPTIVANKIIEHGTLENLVWAVERGAILNQETLFEAITHNKLDMIIWLCDQNPNLLNSGVFDDAIKTKIINDYNLDMLEVITNKGLILTQQMILQAIDSKKIDIVMWLCNKDPNISTYADISIALIRKCNLEILKIAANRGLPLTESMMIAAIDVFKMDILEWLCTHDPNFSTYQMIGFWIITYCDLKILHIAVENKLILTDNLLIEAILIAKIGMVLYLCNNAPQLLTNRVGVKIVKLCNFDILELATKNSLILTNKMLKTAICHGKQDMALWIMRNIKSDFSDDHDIGIQIISHSNPEILKLSVKKGLVLNEEILLRAIEHGKTDMVMWICNNDTNLPTYDKIGVQMVAQCSAEVLMLAVDKGLKLTQEMLHYTIDHGILDTIIFFHGKNMRDDNLCIKAMAKKYYEILKWAKDNWYSFRSATCQAVEEGNLVMLKWCKENKIPMSHISCKCAASSGIIGVFEYCYLEFAFSIDYDTIKQFPESDILKILIKAHNKGITLDLLTVKEISLNCGIEMIDFLKEKGYFIYYDQICIKAIKKTNIDTLKWFGKNGIAFRDDTLSLAVKNNNLDVLQCVIENYYPICQNETTDIYKNIYIKAIENGNIRILECMKKKNLELPKNGVLIAIEAGNMASIKYFLENDIGEDMFKIDFNNLCVIAAEKGNVEILKWIRENNIDFPKNLLAISAKKGNFEIFQYILDSNMYELSDNLFEDAMEGGNDLIINFIVDSMDM